MYQRKESRRALERLLKRRTIADINTLKRILHTSSRTTVFRILSKSGYLTSYSHAGRFYTLRDIPDFDTDGLWSFGDVHFSTHRTLRSTVLYLVETSSAGKTHSELQKQLHLRVQDTLRDLSNESLLGRVRMERIYVYLSARQKKANAQVTARRRMLDAEPRTVSLPDAGVIIDVLLTVINKKKVDAASIRACLRREGKDIAREQIGSVLEHYQVGKKNVT
jgi:hypothetical protein